ncbi:MAG TPA: hypothetical protein VMP01_05000 [Pirellulaceae bacterium]|nr:hypothetical protein [Pirellulaceae bacterium]
MPSSIRVIDPREIRIRGFRDYPGLSDDEKLVYLVMTLESLMDMEGWDDFFTHADSSYFEQGRYLDRLVQGLRVAEDVESAEIVEDYARHLREGGVSMSPHDIDAFLCRQDKCYFASCPDWRAAFSELTEKRWQLIVACLRRKGIELLTA